MSDSGQMQPLSDQSSRKELIDAEMFQEAKKRKIMTKRIGAIEQPLTWYGIVFFLTCTES